jgi:rhodanese-related sulfurtransferase
VKSLLLRSLLILAIALTAALADGALRGLRMPPQVRADKVPTLPVVQVRPTDSPSAVETAPESNGGFTVEMLVALIESGTAILVDARSPAEHRQGRIPGSFQLEPGDVGAASPRRDLVDFLAGTLAGDPTMVLVIYCGGGDCHASHDLGSQMIRYGFAEEQLFIFEGGYPAWVAAGHPIETGEPLF